MRLSLHPQVYADIREIMEYHERAANAEILRTDEALWRIGGTANP